MQNKIIGQYKHMESTESFYKMNHSDGVNSSWLCLFVFFSLFGTTFFQCCRFANPVSHWSNASDEKNKINNQCSKIMTLKAHVKNR